MKARNDDFLERSKHLKAMDDQVLKDYFYTLLDQMIDPLLDLSYTYTSPAIERSVLMRMGFSSIEAKLITDACFEHDLLAHGAGHVVYKFAQIKKLSIRESGLLLLESDHLKFMVEVFSNAQAK